MSTSSASTFSAYRISEQIKRVGMWEINREATRDFLNFLGVLSKLGIQHADICNYWNCSVRDGQLRVISVVKTK